MAVSISKSGGIYIEISGGSFRLREDLNNLAKLAKASGQDISDALSGSLAPKDAARNATSLARSLSVAQRAAQAASADLSSMDKQFREMGKAIGVTEGKLGSFVRMQKQMYQTQAQRAFTSNLKNIQRQTGATDAEMQKLAKSMGSAFEKGISGAKNMELSIAGIAGKVAGIATAYVSLQHVGSFVASGISYNQQLQNAELGIATVLSLNNKIIDSQGKQLVGQEKFNATQQEAVGIVKALDGATATASADFTDLLRLFQTSLGASQSIGLTWKETIQVVP